MKQSWRVGLVAVALLACSVGAAGQAEAGGNLVSNGDFGTGDFTNWALSGDDSQVYVSTGQLSGSTFQAALTTRGMGDGYLTQALSTTSGQQYLVSFLLGDDGSTPNSLAVSLGESTIASFSGAGVDTLPAGTMYSYVVTASSSSSDLTFDFVDVPGYLYVSNISVTNVPEPTAAVSAGLGTLMLLGYLGRKHHKSNDV